MWFLKMLLLGHATRWDFTPMMLILLGHANNMDHTCCRHKLSIWPWASPLCQCGLILGLMCRDIFHLILVLGLRCTICQSVCETVSVQHSVSSWKHEPAQLNFDHVYIAGNASQSPCVAHGDEEARWFGPSITYNVLQAGSVFHKLTCFISPICQCSASAVSWCHCCVTINCFCNGCRLTSM